ncbi:hypothetical protein FCM35_KLT13219 [Carex littledalei]|uniref:Uncharacterized protein n=1 Tax=Carex littledalei TaxID=544730 RepID=A0A833VG44_9POAL|nr:hypothetical protein FCM35_KLT13219 [Carex littledalei]
MVGPTSRDSSESTLEQPRGLKDCPDVYGGRRGMERIRLRRTTQKRRRLDRTERVNLLHVLETENGHLLLSFPISEIFGLSLSSCMLSQSVRERHHYSKHTQIIKTKQLLD